MDCHKDDKIIAVNVEQGKMFVNLKDVVAFREHQLKQSLK